MKAAVFKRYGPPDSVDVEEIPDPRPGVNEILVKIHRSTITMGDSELRRSDLVWWIWLPLRLFVGLVKPRKAQSVLGQEMSGEIVEIGKEVSHFQVGDRVVGPSDQGFGCHAEYRLFSEKSVLCKIPDSLSYSNATTLPAGGMNALYFIEKLDVKPGEKLLINGAGGSIGTFALQLAKQKGAVVTVVDHPDKLKMLQELGADECIDYTKTDYWKEVARYDKVFDIWSKGKFTRAIRAAKRGGVVLFANPMPSQLLLKGWFGFLGKKIMTGIAPYKKESLQALVNMMAEGHLRAAIDQTYTLGEIRDAHRYVDSGEKKGHIIISIG